MATATLTRPKTRSKRKASLSVEVEGNYRLKHVSKERAQLALDEPIEYVNGDWSLIKDHDDDCAADESPEPRRLSAREEGTLFRRMNYLRHQADRLRQGIKPGHCPPDTLDAIERLLDESTRMRNYLVQVFSKLAASVARPYANTEFRVDELLSEAHVTLLRCVEIFDAERGYRFSTYATNAIRHNLNRYISRQHKARQATREYIPTDSLPAPECDNPRRRERQYTDRMSRILKWIHKLDDREQTIVKSRFGLTQASNKVTLQSLADQLGLSRERIRQLEIRALDKLRAMARQTAVELEF
jgi:RNA polymerase sigma factor (sigma-70 family)